MLRLAVLPAALFLSATVALAEPGVPASAAAAAPQSLEVAVLRELADFASTTGPYGVIAVLCLVTRMLYREMRANETAHRAELKDRDDKIAELQDKRAEEGIANARRIEETATKAAATIAQNVASMADWGGLIRNVLAQSEKNGTTMGEMVNRLDRNFGAIENLGRRP